MRRSSTPASERKKIRQVCSVCLSFNPHPYKSFLIITITYHGWLQCLVPDSDLHQGQEPEVEEQTRNLLPPLYPPSEERGGERGRGRGWMDISKICQNRSPMQESRDEWTMWKKAFFISLETAAAA